MAQDYEYYGDYPGLVDGKWYVDLRDGHLYIDSPSGVSLGTFPNKIKFHLMRSIKAFNNGAVDLTDVIFSAELDQNQFIEHTPPGIGRDWYETRLGAVKQPFTIPSDVPANQQILSIVLTDLTNNAFGIINLRHYIEIPADRQLRVSLTNALRYSRLGGRRIRHGDPGSLMNSFVSADYRCYMVQTPANFPSNGRYFTPAQWTTFTAANINEAEYPEKIKTGVMSDFPSTILGSVTTAYNASPIIGLKGKLPDDVESISIKAMVLPFAKELGMLILFNEVKLVDETIKRTALNIFKGQNFEFAYEVKYIGASK